MKLKHYNLSDGTSVWEKPAHPGCGFAGLAFAVVFGTVPWMVSDDQPSLPVLRIVGGIFALLLASLAICIAFWRDRLEVVPGSVVRRIRGLKFAPKITELPFESVNELALYRKIVDNEGSISTYCVVELRWKDTRIKPFVLSELNEVWRFTPNGTGIAARGAGPDALTAVEYARKTANEIAREAKFSLNDTLAGTPQTLSHYTANDAMGRQMGEAIERSTRAKAPPLQIERERFATTVVIAKSRLVDARWGHRAATLFGGTALLFVWLLSPHASRGPALFFAAIIFIVFLLTFSDKMDLLRPGEETILQLDDQELRYGKRKNGLERWKKRLPVSEIRAVVPEYAPGRNVLHVQTVSDCLSLAHQMSADDLETIRNLVIEARPELA